MILSGHMIIKNGVKYDYSFIESCLSALPICDEFIFVEGMGEDGTYEKILELQQQHPDKIKVFQRAWNKEHYNVLSEMTNYAIEQCSGKYHYQIQADEALHEKYHPIIREAVENHEFDLGFLGAQHFYSNFYTIYKPGVFYDKFARIAKKAKFPTICSFSDAMTLGCPDGGNQNIIRKEIPATVYHYGYVRTPKALIEKQKQMTRWWGYQELDQYLADGETSGKINWHQKHDPERLQPFEGSHPLPLRKWVTDRKQIVQEGTV